MTRTEKIERLRKYRPHIYYKLKSNFPKLIENPYQANDTAIKFYNYMIAEEANRDNNNETFKKRFSF